MSNFKMTKLLGVLAVISLLGMATSEGAFARNDGGVVPKPEVPTNLGNKPAVPTKCMNASGALIDCPKTGGETQKGGAAVPSRCVDKDGKLIDCPKTGRETTMGGSGVATDSFDTESKTGEPMCKTLQRTFEHVKDEDTGKTNKVMRSFRQVCCSYNLNNEKKCASENIVVSATTGGSLTVETLIGGVWRTSVPAPIRAPRPRVVPPPTPVTAP